MKASSAVNYLYVHTEDSGVEALLFVVKWLTTVAFMITVPFAKYSEKSYTTVIFKVRLRCLHVCTALQ